MKYLLSCILSILTSLAVAQKPFVLGQIQTLHSTILNEDRELNIYLPDGYKATDTTRYPVVYLLDGSADEDFIHVVGLYQFSSFPWVGRVRPSIIVGIANKDRKRDFTFPSSLATDRKLLPTSGGSASFIAFIEKELQPYIQKTYRTTTDRTIIGESLGGLLASEILLKKPTLFSTYIIVSPSLWWDDASLLSQKAPLLQATFTTPISIYIGVGKEGVSPSATPHVQEVDANLLADMLKRSASKSLRVHFDYLPQEDHASVAHLAVLNALRLLHASEGKQ
jgi:predicted alpha/beta superfamily hydrolase